MHFLSRANKSIVSEWWWTVDRILLVLFFILMVLGVVLVATASPPVASRIGLGEYHFTLRHLIVLGPSFLIMVAISFLDTKLVWRLSLVLLIGSILASTYVLFFGMEIKGAQRWIHFPGFSLQPSEFVKPAFIVVVSWLIASQKEKQTLPVIRIAGGLYVLIVALLVMQPDMGMTFVITFCFMAIIFTAGLPFRYVAILSLVAVGSLVIAYYNFSHFQSRIDRFLDPSAGDTFQIDQSLQAIRNGGLLGTGPAQGTVKLNLPDAHADFIFSVAAEELGLLFVVFLVALYGYVVLRGFSKLMEQDDFFILLASSGLLVMFGLQAFIHMGSSLHLLPTKGMTLPFISYGGSSLLSTSIAMGILLSLIRRRNRSSIAKGGLTARSDGGICR